jgi:chorismate dehydratase
MVLEARPDLINPLPQIDNIAITAVSYLNTKPFLYGIFRHTEVEKSISLSLDIPSVCAQKLKSGEADLGLVPVAIIPELDTPYIVSDYCIGADGKVATVCIYSEVPLKNITHLYLDFHSRTSVALVKILLSDFWQLNPILLSDTEGGEGWRKIGGTTAALVIGDKTIGLEQQHTYTYDLAEAWKHLTGLPFVFAAWVSNRPLKREFVAQFNEALALGIKHIPYLTYLMPDSLTTPNFDIKKYFQENISYHLDEQKKIALKMFLTRLSSKVVLNF